MRISFFRLTNFFILLASTLSATPSYADISQAPPSFPYQDGRAVFVDFQKASYHLIYDQAAKTVTVDSEIVFDSPTTGYPIFDLIPNPRNVKLDDRNVEVDEISDPDKASSVRVVRSIVVQGSHRLTLSHTLTANVGFRENGVASAFWMSDLDDRQYLEQYLPTSFEYDQFPVSMRIEIVNAAGKPHVLHANGAIKNPSENVFEVEFPAFYTTSSIFYHLTPSGAFPSMHFEFSSINGRKLPVEIYSKSDLSAYAEEVKKVLIELEKDYGPFPHSKVIVYGAGTGGMEYSGATMSSLSAVGHELFHSYNARSVMPAQGNSGWIDEAMSSWRDHQYQTRTAPGGTTKMAGHSPWTRMTDDDAYSKGANFLAWIAGRSAAKGKNFKTFLREYFMANLYHTMTTDQLQAAMEKFTGFDLAPEFDTYIYGKSVSGEVSHGSVWKKSRLGLRPVSENPYHPHLSKEELLNLL